MHFSLTNRNVKFLPHRLNFIVNFINNSDFDTKEYLNRICDKTIWDKNDIYFRYFEKIEKENEISIKILYFMSLMDPDNISCYLINDLLKDFTDIERLQDAIDLLIKNGLIESFKTEKYFRIHRLTQELTQVFSVKCQKINFENENKLMSVLKQRFVIDIDFNGFSIKNENKVFEHVLAFVTNLRIKENFQDTIEYIELKAI